MTSASRTQEIQKTELIRAELQTSLTAVAQKIGKIQIGNAQSFPYGWRKSAKGRTVWRILEEAINQNLETLYSNSTNLKFEPSDSEVSMFDFKARGTQGSQKWEAFVNIKSSTIGSKVSKDDLSKADKLFDFIREDKTRTLFIATFGIQFNNDMTIEIPVCYIFPMAWLPDIYVNPSNNGNLQSSMYKNLATATKRTNEEFLVELSNAINVANEKKKNKKIK
jgi:hypothetical protein